MQCAPSRTWARAVLSALALVTLGKSCWPGVARAEDDEVLVRGRPIGGFVSRARIEDSPREVTDAASLVEPLPGVHVRRLGADDSFATLSIRGSSSTQVAIYLAGVPLSGGADPTLDLATLPLWPGAEARVHRTFAPAALGPGSLGGTLVIDPPSPRSASRTEVWDAASSFGSRRLRVGDVRGDPDGVRIASGVSASRSDDDFSYLDPNAPDASGKDVFATRQNAGHAAVAGLVSVAIPTRIGATTSGAVTITGLAQARRQELPGSASHPTLRQRLDSSRLLSVIAWTAPAARGVVGVRAWGRREGLSVSDDPESARTTMSPSSTDDTIVAAGASAGWRGNPTEHSFLELRIDGSGERFAPGTWVGWRAPPSARRASVGVALDASTLVAKEVNVSASMRADGWFDSSGDGANTSSERPTGNVGLEFPIGPIVLASHAGFVARAPSFVERYGNRGAFIGDPGLRPESAFTADAGARFTRRYGVLHLHASASGFATWARDLITFVPTGAYGRGRATNIGEARMVGLEAELRATVVGFDARLSSTSLRTENGAECQYTSSACERPALPGRPAHDLVGDLAWEHGPVRLRYGVDMVSGIFTDLKGAVEVPARVLHGAGLRVLVPNIPGLSLSLDVRNLFDLRAVDYRGVTGPVREPIGDLYDYPLPGRRVLFSARWTSTTSDKPR